MPTMLLTKTQHASLQATASRTPDSPKKAAAVGIFRWLPFSRRVKGSRLLVLVTVIGLLLAAIFFFGGKKEGHGFDFDFQSYGEAALHTDGLFGAAAATAAASANWISHVFEVSSSHATQLPNLHCTDKCGQAQDGVCNDGRPNINGSMADGSAIMCDLGADCNDCGAWQGSYSESWYRLFDYTPLAYLFVEHQIVARARMTTTTPPFVFPYADPRVDVDVSGQMDKYGLVEGGITAIFREIMTHGGVERCVDPVTGKRQLVLDVGANFGYFTVYAAMHGCRVIAWEPVPMFRAFMEWAVAANNISHLVEIRPFVASHETNTEVEMGIPVAGIWGVASVNSGNLFPDEGRHTIKAITERIDDVVQEDVLIMKVDVEGWEPYVFKGANALLTNHKVENIISEYSPGVAERPDKPSLLWDNPLMLVGLAMRGYQLQWLPDGFSKAPNPVRKGVLPALEQITLENLMYDVHDVELRNRKKLGCGVPGKLGKYKAWRKCNWLPFDVNPRSFRSSFWYNTNIWATRLNSLQNVTLGPVGLAPLHGPLTGWHVEGLRGRQGFGLGMQWCRNTPAKKQVKYRCPCTVPAVCGKEEKTVLALAKEGQMPQNYQIPADYRFPADRYPLPALEDIPDANMRERIGKGKAGKGKHLHRSHHKNSAAL